MFVELEIIKCVQFVPFFFSFVFAFGKESIYLLKTLFELCCAILLLTTTIKGKKTSFYLPDIWNISWNVKFCTWIKIHF